VKTVMNIKFDYFVPRQDPILGIKPANMVETLTLDNWQSKAITRKQGNANHYVYLSLATRCRDRKRFYCVNTYDLDNQVTLSQVLFPSPEEALASIFREIPQAEFA